VRLSHDPGKTRAVFDDPNLLSHAGLAPVMALAGRAGLPGLLAGVRPGGACGVNAGTKVACLIVGMAAGADSIDDMDLLRDGAMETVFADSPFEMIQAEGQHRDHAIVEQVIADQNTGPLAHLPSGQFTANAAWLVIAAMAFNLLRAAGTLAGRRYAKARTATVRRDIVTIAARTARHGRGNLTLHLPAGHHREQAWLNLWTDACGPPARAA
jgi:hypothetical protein